MISKLRHAPRCRSFGSTEILRSLRGLSIVLSLDKAPGPLDANLVSSLPRFVVSFEYRCKITSTAFKVSANSRPGQREVHDWIMELAVKPAGKRDQSSSVTAPPTGACHSHDA